MSENNQEMPIDPIFGKVKDNWGWLLGLGILFLILGIIGLGMTFTLTQLSMIFFGVLFIIGGGVQIVHLFKCGSWKGVFWHLIIGVLYIAAGITCISNPMLASTVITAVLGVMFIAIGLSRLIMAFTMRGNQGWGWVLVSGVITFLLGLIILLHWPLSGLWFIGMIIAIELIIHGWAYIFVALAARNASSEAKV